MENVTRCEKTKEWNGKPIYGIGLSDGNGGESFQEIPVGTPVSELVITPNPPYGNKIKWNKPNQGGGFGGGKQQRAGNESFALAYAKDIAVAHIEKGKEFKASDVVKVAEEFYQWMESKKSKVMNEEINHPSQLLTLGPSTSTQINVFSDGIIESVKNGEINPIAVLIQLKALEVATERIRKEIHENVITEVSKYPDKVFKFQGNDITKAEHGGKYEYIGCGDPEWLTLESQRTIIEAKQKQRETLLKALKQPLETFDGDTGETHLLLPPVKKGGKSGINISLK